MGGPASGGPGGDAAPGRREQDCGCAAIRGAIHAVFFATRPAPAPVTPPRQPQPAPAWPWWARHRPGQRQAAAAALALGVLGLHAWVLTAATPAGAPPSPDAASPPLPRQATTRPDAARPLHWRVLPAPAQALAPTEATPPAPITPMPITPARMQPAQTAPARSPTVAPAPAAPPRLADAAPAGSSPQPAPIADMAGAMLEDAPAALPAAAPAVPAVPVYATRPPPPAGAPPAVQPGPLDGLGAASHGQLATAGLVPERFVERRRGRDQRAANFHPQRQEVRGSGGGAPWPWPEGGQDRLSWLLQLAAVLQANPALAQPGSQVVLAVAGPQGPTAVWTFAVRGPEAVTLPDGSQPQGLALQRLPEHPYDLQVDAWLDPADHHLPLRWRLSAPPGRWASDWLRLPAP